MSEKPGDMPWRRANVLRSPIPAGGFGRVLRPCEVRALRALGWSCGDGWIVVRSDSREWAGIVYKPAPRKMGGGYNHADIYVAMA